MQNQTRRSLLSAFAGGVSKSRLGAKLPVLGEEREGAEEEEGGQEQEDEGGDGAGAGGEGGSANTSREGSRNEEPSSLEARQEGRPKHPSQNRIHTALVRGVSMAQEEGDMVAAGVPASALAERLHGLVKTGGSMEMQGVVTDMASRPETPVDEEKLSGEAQVGRDKRSRLGTRVTVFADLDSISEGGSEPSSAAGRRQLSRQESTQRFRSSQNPCVADSRNPSVAEALPRVVKERPRWTSAFGDMLEKEDPHGSLDRDILDLKLMLGEPADSKHKAGTPSQDERCEVVLDAAVSALQIPEGGRQSTPGPSDHESQPVFMMTAGEDELPGPRRRERRRPKGEGSEEMLKGDGIMTHRDLRSKFADRVQRVAPVLKMIAWAGKQIADDGRSGAGNQALAEEKGISDNCAERVSWEHSHDTARPLSTSPERTSSSHRASCDGVGSAGSVAHGGSCGSEPVQEETQAALRQDSVQDMRRSSNETASVPHDDNVLPDKANNLIAGKLGYGVQSLEDHPQQTKTRHKPKVWNKQLSDG